MFCRMWVCGTTPQVKQSSVPPLPPPHLEFRMLDVIRIWQDRVTYNLARSRRRVVEYLMNRIIFQTKSVFHWLFGTRIKCPVGASEGQNLSEICIGKPLNAIISAWCAEFWTSHCIMDILNVKHQRISVYNFLESLFIWSVFHKVNILL